jgi:cytochrome c-type biogenesis protein CcmH/NrfG
MLMNRERLGFWMRLVAILLAVFFIGSFVLLGLGTNVNYNLFDLIGGGDQQEGAEATTGTEDQISAAEEELEQNPDDPENIKTLAALYYQNGRYEDAERVLEEGRKVAPRDEEIALTLGQVRYQRAQSAPEESQRETYDRAGDAFAAAAELDPENEDAYLAAGEAYDRAGQPAQAIKYWNGYLELEPEGEQADAVKERISELLEGEENTTGGG